MRRTQSVKARAIIDNEEAARALAWAAHGMDLADALHLASADGCEAFVTFERDFAKRASAVGIEARAL